MPSSKQTPQTHADIFPSLSYDDAPVAIEWLCNVFGFKKRLVVQGPEGSITHSELSLGTGVIMVSSARPDKGRLGPRTLAGVNQALCIRIVDPDAHYDRTKAAGVEILEEIKDEEFGSRGYSAKDLEGHHWYFGTYQPGAYWDGKDGVDPSA